jgi:hypothetical protein
MITLRATELEGKSVLLQAMENGTDASTKEVTFNDGNTSTYYDLCVKNKDEDILAYRDKEGVDQYIKNGDDFTLQLTFFAYKDLAEIVNGESFDYLVKKMGNKYVYLVSKKSGVEDYVNVKSGNVPLPQGGDQASYSEDKWSQINRNKQLAITMGQCLNLACAKIPLEDGQSIDDWVRDVGLLRDKLYLDMVKVTKLNTETLEEDDDAMPF